MVSRKKKELKDALFKLEEKAQHNELQSQMDTAILKINEELNKEKAKSRSLEAQITELKKKNDVLTTKVTNIEGKNVSPTKQYNELFEQNKNLKKEKQNLEAYNATYERIIRTIMAELSSWKNPPQKACRTIEDISGRLKIPYPWASSSFVKK